MDEPLEQVPDPAIDALKLLLAAAGGKLAITDALWEDFNPADWHIEAEHDIVSHTWTYQLIARITRRTP